MRRPATGVGLAFVAVAAGVAVKVSYVAMRTTACAFDMLQETADFNDIQNQAASNVRAFSLAAGRLGRNASSWEQHMISKSIDNEVQGFAHLKKRFKTKRKRSRALRAATKVVRDYETAMDVVVEFHVNLTMWAFEIGNATRNDDFESYWRAFQDKASPEARKVRTAFNKQEKRLVVSLDDISSEYEATAFVVVCVAVALLSVALVGLTRLFVASTKEHSAVLAAQDKLAHQQAHEMRNKYAPAIYFMQHFVDACESRPAVDDFLAQADDMQTALLLLKEVEAQHQARLDCYKILRGNYVTHLETFDVVSFLQQRVNIESTIARARNSGRLDVDYRVEIPETCGDVVDVRADMYILNHVVQNCLSNARKHTYHGEVVARFEGARDGRLVFAVLDTGAGLPQKVAAKIFSHEVATGDHRGTGLGLPSCALFCDTAGGYIRLKATRRQDTAGSNGFTVFEFAVAGTVVGCASVDAQESFRPISTIKAARPDPPCEVVADSTLPDEVTVVVVDDSDLNRKCILRAVQKVARSVGARGWHYEQFETVEASQLCIRELHAQGRRAIVCLDENMQSRGGVMTGTQAARWLLEDLHFCGIVISASGDPLAGQAHLDHGAHLVWGKPLPKSAVLHTDLVDAFARL